MNITTRNLAKLVFCAVFTYLSIPSYCGAAEGIGGVFLKPRELVKGDYWGNKVLPPPAVSKNLSQYDVIWCAQLIHRYNPAAWDVIRKQSSRPLLFNYISGDSAQLGSDFVTFDYAYIEKRHPEWFLLQNDRVKSPADYNDPDKRIRWSTANRKHGDYTRFVLDVGNKVFQQWAAQQVLERVSGRREHLEYGYDGLAMDNVGLAAFEKLTTKRYPYWKYAGDSKAWNTAYFEFIRVVHDTLKAKGYAIILNHTTDYGSNKDGQDWDTLFLIADGLMDEYALGPPKTVWVDSQWLWTIKHHEDTLAKGLFDWWIIKPSEDERVGYEQFLYTYCTFLLTKKPGKSFYSASRGVAGYGNPMVPWYEEYDLPTGKPRSARYSQGRCWLRDYENAKIVVNPTENSEKVVVDKDKYWLDWVSKTKVIEAEIPPHSGRIFLPTSYPVKEGAAK